MAATTGLESAPSAMASAKAFFVRDRRLHEMLECGIGIDRGDRSAMTHRPLWEASLAKALCGLSLRFVYQTRLRTLRR